MLETSPLHRHGARATTLAQTPSVDLIRTIMANTTQFRGVVNVEGQFLEVNPLSLEFLGVSRCAVVGTHIWEGFWWHTDEAKEEVFQLLALAQQGETSSSELEIIGKDHRLWIEFLLKPVRDQAGDIVMILAEGNDITARKRLEAQLRDSERQHRLVIEAMSEGVLKVERDGRVSMCNAAAERILGQSRENLLNRRVTQGWSAMKEDGTPLTAVDSPTALTFASGQPQSNFVMGIVKPGAKLTWVLVNTRPLSHIGEVLPYAVVTTLVDISERKTLEDKLRQAALYDALTGLPSRTLLMERLAQASHRAHRDSQAKFAVLFLDLDNFKAVNDTLGHEAGDGLLRKVAHILQGCVREADTVARLGGDEFVILLEGVTCQEAAMRFAERARKKLRLKQGDGAKRVEVQASVGIVLGDAHTDPTVLLKRADDAMYQAKARGRSQVAVWAWAATQEVHDIQWRT